MMMMTHWPTCTLVISFMHSERRQCSQRLHLLKMLRQ